LLLVAFPLVNAPNCHLSLVLASVVQGDAVNCNTTTISLWEIWTKSAQLFFYMVAQVIIVHTSHILSNGDV